MKCRDSLCLHGPLGAYMVYCELDKDHDGPHYSKSGDRGAEHIWHCPDFSNCPMHGGRCYVLDGQEILRIAKEISERDRRV